eukprot:jgi/Botrbrau1/14618/Bobra.0364s0002.1
MTEGLMPSYVGVINKEVGCTQIPVSYGLAPSLSTSASRAATVNYCGYVFCRDQIRSQISNTLATIVAAGTVCIFFLVMSIIVAVRWQKYKQRQSNRQVQPGGQTDVEAAKQQVLQVPMYAKEGILISHPDDDVVLAIVVSPSGERSGATPSEARPVAEEGCRACQPMAESWQDLQSGGLEHTT